MKPCTKCGIEKSFDSFCKNAMRKDGLQAWCKDCKKRWRDANPERHRENSRRWREAHPEKCREYNRNRREASLEKRQEYDRRYREANSENRREYNRRWRAAHPEYDRNWQAANLDKRAANERKRRSRKLNAPGDHATAEQVATLDQQCQCCKTTDNLAVDHIVALVNGGSDSIENLQILCRSCNSSKNTSEQCRLEHQ